MRVHPRVRHALIIALLSLANASCDDAPDKGKPDPAPVMKEAMVLDGVAITRKEIEDWLPYLREVSPSTGHNSGMRYLLDRYLIPMAFARTKFATRHEEQRKNAEGIAKVLGDSAGYAELLERTRKFSGAEVLTDLLRTDLPLPEQRWLFDDANVGRVSPVLETAQGFSLVAASDKQPGLTKAFDRVDAILVRFYTHTAKDHGKWCQALKVRLGSLAPEAIKVHPEFRDALPNWPKPKK
jgi:hypothetical protein